MRTENPRGADIRSMIGTAREVCLRMNDARVIFCSVVSPRSDGADAFVVRPWGVEATATVRYDDVRRATSVTEMVWQRQRAISRAQLAGVFVD
ncbi:MAG TPA: hypothetical protein VHE30_14335 [Polyangiaceae bacterium]|nr:hypothetical protein [Polyangiaceae bacterium]